jgi:thiosulfate dehydrogenase
MKKIVVILLSLFSSLYAQQKQFVAEAIDPPQVESIPQTKEGEMIKYGRELIINTAQYLGPKGSVAQISNGMNCQNCHLDAGTRPYGNHYLSVHATYPKYRDRSASIETLSKRVNDCFERSLNGKKLKEESKEMQAILVYMKWLGSNHRISLPDSRYSIATLPYLDRAASPEKGKVVYDKYCVSCHQANGEGMANPAIKGAFIFPPLWGKNSYNQAAGLFRLSRFAGFVKDNMPHLSATHDKPILSDEEAWDVAAYVNHQPRPGFKGQKNDWPEISAKPIDHPFGPYHDGFSEEQHKYGPFQPIVDQRKKIK